MPPAILIADPLRQSRDLTISMFHALGYRYVWAADDAERTKGFLAAVIFDYVLVDSQLPGSAINTIIAYVRGMTTRTKIVVIANLPNAFARYPEASAVIPKPLTFEVLKQLIEPESERFSSVIH